MHPDTLTRLLARNAANAPGAIDAGGVLSWGQLAARAEGYAAHLARLGVGRGGRVALWLPNSADYLALIFAVARLGAVAVHVNTRFRAEEVSYLLRRARPTVLVSDPGFGAVDFTEILAEVPAEDRASLAHVLARADLDPTGQIADAARPDDPCLTYTTSGTTSGPKLVLHCQRAIAGHAADACTAFGLAAPGAALLAAVPLCGTFGNASAMAAIAGGAPVVCLDRFDATQAARLIRAHAITHMVGGDDMLARIAEAAGDKPFTTMRLFGFAAFHPNPQTAIAAAEAAGLAPRGLYGSSEVQALFACSPDAWRTEAGGVPVRADAAFAIRDPETGLDLPDGEAGELCIRTPSMFLGYLDNPEATARAMTADGYFRTGDLAHRNGRGFVFQARMGDVLRLGGFLVNPEEIEAFFQAQPGIAAAQVVAVEQDGGLVPVAFVRLAAGAVFDEAALLAAARARLARFKVPAHIVAVAEFPVTLSPNGVKIQRVRLREMAAALLEPNRA